MTGSRALCAAVFACLTLGACAVSLPPPSLTFDNVQRLRAASMPALAVGEFTRGPGLSARDDQGISIRAEMLRPPTGGTFSAYLRDTVEMELTGAGKLDSASPFVLTGELTRSEVSTSGAQSRALLGAQFRLTRAGQMVFEEEVVVSEEWPSSYWGIEAIPAAMNHYTGLYAKLFGALLADPEFQSAVRQ